MVKVRATLTALFLVWAAPLLADDESTPPQDPKARSKWALEHRTFNVRLDLPPLALGALALEGDWGFADRFSAGPMLAVTRQIPVGEFNLRVATVGLRLNWHVERTRYLDGWLIGVFVEAGRVSITSQVGSVDVMAELGYGRVGALLAYQWVWDFGLSLNLGLGYSRFVADTQATLTGSSGSVTVSRTFEFQALEQVRGNLPVIELMVGWVF